MRYVLIILLLALVAGCAGADPTGVASDRATTGAASRAPASAPPGSDAADPLLAFELVDVRSGETFTLGELAADEPVLLETMAIWCTTCLRQQREVVAAHAGGEFHSVGIDVDPNERADELAAYAEREGFDWRFAIADAELVRLLTDRFGLAVTNPPSTPTFVVTGGTIRALEFNRVRTADELLDELAAG
jgi:thiol-disulfide isomerase/thioredoxin